MDLLNNNFRPRYVAESIPFETDDLNEVGIPMLCFCDIRLSEVNEHTDWYGEYGIGMRSAWGVKNGLTPVQYYNKSSYLIKDLGRGLKKMRSSFKKIKIGDIESTEIPEWYFSVYLNIWYMKEYKGKQLHRKSNKDKSKKFYDEKEWRYIPPYKELKKLPEGLPISLNSENLRKCEEDDTYIKQLNGQLGMSTTLKFEHEDIAYIIISSETERLEMIDEIKHAQKNYTESEIALLSSKIVSLEQIRSDF